MLTIVVALAALVPALFYVQRSKAKAPASTPPPAVPVSVGQAGRRDVPEWARGLGTVQALNVVTVKSRVDGQLDRIAFVEGQMVKAGDLLAQIDPRPFQVALAQAEANQRKDDAQRANAQTDLKRYAELAKMQVVPAQQLDAQQAQAQSLLATVAADRSAADNARLQLGFTRIVAPISGRVGQRLVDQGSQVHASDTTGLVTITQLEPITVTFLVPQDALPAVMRAGRAGAARVEVDTRDGRLHLADGTLVYVDSQVDPASGQILLKAQFANADHALWPGELVSARLLLQVHPQAVVVPAQAVQRDQNGAYLYVVGAGRTAQPRPVRLGPADGGTQVIESGVSAGDTVVLDGQSRLTAGSRVSFAAAAAADSAGAAAP
ncbi:efflux RND transporter periplasmic adaptor subunit [Frateuria defendens]|uniref:efflux RND transporter periplasmic adaptor subunit n=1 Tax=Frateuria defendens TaxID=2219559 RepID=UPI0007DC38B5|nr:efflux RND transporter periplasmic adaptor subunit [Frateuria defendens]